MTDANDVSALIRQFADQSDGFDPTGWHIVAQHKNPWGRVPMTDGGKFLDGGSRAYMDQLLATQMQPDPKSRRHHYVPRTYLKKWGFDDGNKRVWNLDTVTGKVRAFSVNDVCVGENFYRVVGRDGEAHNRVEAMFGVVDSELGRVQRLFERLQNPDELTFDDLMGLGVTVAAQRMRTAQQRRLLLQHDAWLVAQNPEQFKSMEDPSNPLGVAGVHTETLFAALWEAADVMTTRSIEVWDDPEGRFWTCDAPVLVPFLSNKRPSLMAAPHILWPVSPYRVVALTNAPSGEKAVIRQATAKERGLVRKAIEQGRERWIFASPDQKDRLPKTKKFGRRAQVRLRCAQWTPRGEPIKPPGCCVEQTEGFAAYSDVALCNRGLHTHAPRMRDYT